MIRRRRNNGF